MNPDTIEKVALVVVGWLLALLSPIITDAVKRKRENAAVRLVLIEELRATAYKLALANHFIVTHFGELNRAHLMWIRSIIERYAGTTPSESIKELVDFQLSCSDDQIAQFNAAGAAPPGRSVTLQKYLVPLLDSRISSLWYFRGIVTPLLLDIKSRLNLLNDTVDLARQGTNMTFAKLEGDNYQRVVDNIKGHYRMYAEEARRVVDKIVTLETVI